MASEQAIISTENGELIKPIMGDTFVKYYMGTLMKDPRLTITELVANTWDAGAKNVKITWPTTGGGLLEIEDDGHGLSKEDFLKIWPVANYERLVNPDKIENQGLIIEVADGSGSKRTTFGRNGMGRFSLFLFSKEYFVETWKNGKASSFRVFKSNPYEIEPTESKEKEGHGTRIWLYCERSKTGIISDKEVINTLGSRFLSDPSFAITVNGTKVVPAELGNLCKETPFSVSAGNGKIKRFNATSVRGTTNQRGIAWWVTNRPVGEPSWIVPGHRSLLDGRTIGAKAYLFVVEADFLRGYVREDWMGFNDTEDALKILGEIYEKINLSLQDLQKTRRDRMKKKILKANQIDMNRMSQVSRKMVEVFVDTILKECPGIGEDDLDATVRVLTKLQITESGYELMERLASTEPDELDDLNGILAEWTMYALKKVFDEIDGRLKLIEVIDKKTKDSNTKELTELQPLFKTGLWMFGSEYESCYYTSNRTITTVLRKLIGDDESEKNNKRPDFVVVSKESTLGVHTLDHYDYEVSDGEVKGLEKILIVELKRGGSIIDNNDVLQAVGYVNELYDCGKISSETQIVAYVLGDKLSPKAREQKVGKENQGKIYPMAYCDILRRAEVRTLDIKNKIKADGFELDAPKTIEVGDLTEYSTET